MTNVDTVGEIVGTNLGVRPGRAIVQGFKRTPAAELGRCRPLEQTSGPVYNGIVSFYLWWGFNLGT